jgi:hypothetical protein
MLRQRQLALERQKRANKNALGPSVIAQANDLPILGAANLLPKAAGWSHLLDLGPGTEKPSGLHQEPAVPVKKSPAAAAANKRNGVAGGTTSTATRVTTAQSSTGDSLSGVENPDDIAVQHIEELNLAGVPETKAQDGVGTETKAQDSIGPLPERKKEMAGWNLEIEEVGVGKAPQELSRDDDDSNATTGRRWFRPWKSKPTNKNGTVANSRPVVEEATSISNFDVDHVTAAPLEVPSNRNDNGRSSPSTGWGGAANSAMYGARRQVQENSTSIDISPLALLGDGQQEKPEKRTFKGPPRRMQMALPGGIDNDDVEAIN